MSSTNASIYTPTIPAQQPKAFAAVIASPSGYNGTAGEYLFWVVAGTWKEKDSSESEVIRGGPNGVTLVDAFWDPGVDASCTILLGIVSGTPTPQLTKGCAITEYVATGTARTWVVMDAETESIGDGKPTRQMLKLQIKASLVPSTS